MSLQIQLLVTDNVRNTNLQLPQFTVTVGNGKDARQKEIATTEEQVTIDADVTGGFGPGYIRIRNHDAANYVQVGIASGAFFGRIDAGESVLFKLDAAITDLFFKANTAAVEIEFEIYERAS